MVGGFPWRELAFADQSSPNTTSHNKDLSNRFDLLLFVNHD